MATKSMSAGNNPAIPLSSLISTTRKRCGFRQAELGAPELSAAYCAALEQGAVAPSRSVLKLLAPRLQLSLDQLLGAAPALIAPVTLAAVGEDVVYQGQIALAAIRGGDAEKGLAQSAEIAAYSAPYHESLAPGIRYLSTYLRGRAYYELRNLDQAKAELEQALILAQPDAQAMRVVHNLLGLIAYDQELPDIALEHHLQCLTTALDKHNKDLNLRVSMLRNIANDYLVLGDTAHAIALYKEVLQLLEDLDAEERKAATFWGLMMAYRTKRDTKHALLYGGQALEIYDACDQRGYAAMVGLNMAEVLFISKRYDEGEKYLKKVKWFLRDSDEPGPFSYLNADYAELALHRGQLEEATTFAQSGIKFAQQLYELSQETGRRFNHAAHAYASALQTVALVKAAKGDFAQADELFEQAIAVINKTTLDDAKMTITESYARVLNSRGAFQRSMFYYQLLASMRPRSWSGRVL